MERVQEERLARPQSGGAVVAELQPPTETWTGYGSMARSLGLERSAAVEVSPVRLAAAGASWLVLAFMGSYVLLPAALGQVGLLASLPYSLPAFLVMLVLTIGGIGLVRPRVQLSADPLPTEPVVAAAAGYFACWAVLHNVLPGLIRFEDMHGLSLATLALINVFEAATFGVVLATLARTPSRAFALGVVFQGLFAALFVGLALSA